MSPLRKKKGNEVTRAPAGMFLVRSGGEKGRNNRESNDAGKAAATAHSLSELRRAAANCRA